tara:strand:+ start:61808 stop:62326 length:519 start_codon:yes stop_codon:yes gene_type:complete
MISKDELDIITIQLGRAPVGALEVMARDSENQPAVLKVDPFPNKKPFPSLYWLTSPILHKAIADIERTAWIKEFENEIIPNNEDFLARIQNDNQLYRDLRWALFKSLHDENLVEEKYLKVLRETGIGGIQNFTRVRCLHMHYAFHVVHGGLVGEELDRQYDLKSLLYHPSKG